MDQRALFLMINLKLSCVYIVSLPSALHCLSLKERYLITLTGINQIIAALELGFGFHNIFCHLLKNGSLQKKN